MSRRFWPALTALACAAAVCLVAGPGAKAPAAGDGAAKKAADKDVFGVTKVHAFHLEVAAKEWAKMQPKGGGMPFGPGGGRPGGPGGPGGPPAKPADKSADSHRGGGFGMEFPWAHGAFTALGKTVANVGVRYKGNASYMASSRGLKRNLKIEFDHYDTELRLLGLKTLNLNAGAMDPTRAREALSFAVFKAAGVPAPRTAYAEVTLTVPGKYDRELLGLYTVVEQVDRTFLKDRFQNGKGLLMKPERLRSLEYLGDDWNRYKAQYQPKHDPSEKEARRLIEFVRLVNRAGDEQFRKEIGSYLDVEEFLRFIAVNALLANLDSFFSMGHNFYIYLNPQTNKFVFIPWDMDLSLAGFPMMGGPDQQMDLSLTHPHVGDNKLIDRLLATKAVGERYQEVLKELAATCFTKERLLADIDAIEAATKEARAREARAVEARKEGQGGFGFGPPGGGPPGGGPPGGGPRGGPPGGGPGGPFGMRSPSLRDFVEKRVESVETQLAGKSKGFVPRGMGPGGPGGFGIGNLWARPLLQAVDADKDGKVTKDEFLAAARKFFDDCDKGGQGALDEKALIVGLNRILAALPGFGPPGGGPGGRPGGGPGGPPGGPGGANAGRLAVAIVRRADADKDGQVTREEFLAAAEALFKEADRSKKGTLDEGALAAGINLLLPQPGFGPGGPGGRPGGFGMGNFMARPLLEALDTNKDGKVSKEELIAGVKRFFKDSDKDGKGKLDEPALAAGLNRLFPPPPGIGPPGGGPPGGGPPGGFGPGMMLAGPLLRRADADKDDKVTLDELVALAETLFKQCDKEKKGALGEAELAAGIGLLFPPPPGFGPPGGRPE
jgi:spore coat protein CotH/Ca2+-binding EF-hand superfamily protein